MSRDGIGIMELSARTCRFPFGDTATGTTYCGAKTRYSSPYCQEHHDLTHTPSPDELRRQRRRELREARRAEAAE